MRYAQRGGYTPAEQQRREQLGLEAAARFACGDKISQIAHDFAGHPGVGAAVAPGLGRGRDRGAAVAGAGLGRAAQRAAVGPVGVRAGEGPLAHGFAADQRWTLGRIKGFSWSDYRDLIIATHRQLSDDP